MGDEEYLERDTKWDCLYVKNLPLSNQKYSDVENFEVFTWNHINQI